MSHTVDKLALVLSNGDVYEFVESGQGVFAPVQLADRAPEIAEVPDSPPEPAAAPEAVSEVALETEPNPTEETSAPLAEAPAEVGADPVVAKSPVEPLTPEAAAPVTVVTVRAPVTIAFETVLFEANSDQLTSKEKEKLRSFTAVLLEHPDADVLVEGFSALSGTLPQQKWISVQRAAAVRGYLIEIAARRADQILMRGWGAERPAADNTSDAGRTQNRRVEILLLGD